MSNLARYFKNLGKKVLVTIKRHALTELIEVVFQFILKMIYMLFKDFTKIRWLLLPAVPKTHSEWNYFLERDFQEKKERRF
jgi:UDP-N-acetylmuramate--alanine ligase